MHRPKDQLPPEDANLLDALIQMSPVAVAVADLNHKITLTNPAFNRIFGYTLEECVGKTVNDLIVPPGAAVGFQENAQLVLGGGVVAGTMTRRRKDGSVVYVESYAVPISSNGERQGIVAVYQDVTQRVVAEFALRQSEEVFRMLSATAPVGIFRTDANGTPDYVNERLTEITGITTEQSCMNRWIDSLHPEDQERALRLWNVAVQRGEDLVDEHRIVRSDGTIVWVAVRARWARGPDGKLHSFVGVVEDITAIRESHEKMRKAKEAAEAASRAKGEFLANMSHEIRTPLNGIVGMTDLALDTNLTLEQREFLDIVKLSADSLLAVIHDILYFSKIEAGKLDMEIIEFNLRDCLDDIIKAVSLRAHEKGLELACHILPEVPDALLGDPTRLRQIVINLLGNAIKFTSHGEVLLRVEPELETENEAILHFSVTDTGVGIPSDKQASIFEAFTQADNSTTRKYGGTGLGLSICSRLVEMMGGRMWLESKAGRGSTFHFSARFQFQKASSSKHVTVGLEELRNVSVLIVDDSATNRRILKEMLLGWDMRPVETGNGRSALDLLKQAATGKSTFF